MKRLLLVLPIALFGASLNADMGDFKLFEIFKKQPEKIVVAPEPTPAWADLYTQAQEIGACTWTTLCAAGRESWLATKEMGNFALDTGNTFSQIVYKHPKVAACAGIVALLAYARSWSTLEVEAQYHELQRFIDNTLAKATQFDTSAENIRAKKTALMSACGIYMPVMYAPIIGPWLYENEVRAIDNLFEQIVILKRYMDERRDTILIQSQTKETLDAVRLVQLILSKKLNFYAAQRILVKK